MIALERESLWRRSGHWRWITSFAVLALALGITGSPWRAKQAEAEPGPSTYAAPQSAPAAMPVGPGASLQAGVPARAPSAGNAEADQLNAASSPAPAAKESGATSLSAGQQTRGSVVWSGGGRGIGGTVSGGGLIAAYCCAGAMSTVWASKHVSNGRHYWELTLSARPGEQTADTWTAAGVGSHGTDGGRIGPTAVSRGGPQTGLSIEVGRDKSIRSGDVLMFALDADKKLAFWGVNGQWRNGTPGVQGGTPLQLTPGEQFAPFGSLSASSGNTAPEGDRWIANFGNQKFRFPLPAGFDSYGTSGGAGALVQASAAAQQAAGPPQGLPDSMIGRISNGSITVSGQVIPLPDGAWTTLAFFKGSQAAPGDAMVLGQIVSGQLKRMVAIHAYRKTGDVPFKSAPMKSCSRQDMVFVEDSGAKPDSTRCWWVNHATSVWENQALLRSANLELAQRKVNFSSVFLNAGFHRANPDGFATAFYYFDPTEEGIGSSATQWQSSEWHKSRISSDPQRLAYVEKTISWGRGWAPIFFATK